MTMRMRDLFGGLMPALALVLSATGCGGGEPANGQNPPAGDRGVADRPGMAAPAESSTTMLTVSPEQRARFGIVMVTAERRALVRTVRLVGRVVPAETAARTVTTKVDGFVERLYVDFTGREVRRGEPLFDLYSPMVVAAQQELLLAVRLRDALGSSPTAEGRANADSLVEGSRRRLRYWDVDEEQIHEVERSGTTRRVVTFRSPITGTVMEKSVIQGQSIMAGAALFQIADLSMVWLEADVFENDLGDVRAGQHAEVSFDAYPGEPLHGRVTYVYPTVDPVARTGKVRIELPNTANRVRPGMFGSVRIDAPVGNRVIVIPRQAALVTGDRQLVFVEDDMGMLVPRLVTLGTETDSLVEVRTGLRVGERVVATAAFLLDAESNLGAAMAGMAGMDMGGQGQKSQADRRSGGQSPPPPPAVRRDSAKAMPGMPNMPEHQQH
jgi:membrane fusion protein, copper/silver efflux system